ncbi:MAG: hypothetical protein QW607_03890 [Desulfurococcaceae archaeon]
MLSSSVLEDLLEFPRREIRILKLTRFFEFLLFLNKKAGNEVFAINSWIGR